MLRSRPKYTYSGLTIVLSNASRFDRAELLSANGGAFFNEKCLRPDFNKWQCDIRVKEDMSSLLPNTKCVLLLGEPAMQMWTGNTTNSLGEIRGSVVVKNGIPHIASFTPQDCVDFKDFEGQLNPNAIALTDEYGDTDEDESGDEKRRHGHTKRKNFGFWLMRDCLKVKHILLHGLPEQTEPEYVIYPRQEQILESLNSAKNETLYLDIETDYECNIHCFSFSFDSRRIFCVPCLLPDYTWAYTGLPFIYRALTKAIQANVLVCHNGANFDYFVLAHKYRIPINRVYDTMIAHHRCWPEAEKSLGHATSHLTWEPFHKDEDAPYNNLDNARRKWEYCGKDVFTMALIKEAIDSYSRTVPGLQQSIAQAMSSIKPYLLTSLLGIQYQQSFVDETIKENDRLMMHYVKSINYLVGEQSLKIIRGKSKSSLPGSNVQCCRYFHDLLGYPVVAKGKEKQDGSRGASLGRKAMLKLRLQNENPVIDLCLAYRERAKETGSLKFIPWKE